MFTPPSSLMATPSATCGDPFKTMRCFFTCCVLGTVTLPTPQDGIDGTNEVYTPTKEGEEEEEEEEEEFHSAQEYE